MSKKGFCIFFASVFAVCALGLLAACDFTFVDRELTSIELNTADVKTFFLEGEAFSYDGLKVSAHYSDGSSHDAKSGYRVLESSFELDDSERTAGFAERSIRVVFGNCDAQYSVTVAALQGIQADFSQTKTTYALGEAFSSDGLAVSAVYAGEHTLPVDLSEVTVEAPLLDEIGDHVVTVRLERFGKTFTDTYSVTVTDPKELGIRADASSAKLKFFEGDDFVHEGLKIELLRTDGAVPLSDGYTVEVDPQFLLDGKLVRGTATVTVKYHGFSTTYAIEITPVELLDLSVDVDGAQTEFEIGEAFSADGIAVAARFNSGTRTLSEGEYTVSQADTDATGKKTVTVSFEFAGTTKTATYEIVVVRTLQSLSVTQNTPIYYAGMTFRRADFTVTAHFTKGEEPVTGYVLAGANEGEILTAGAHSLTFSYAAQGEFDRGTAKTTHLLHVEEVVPVSMTLETPAATLVFREGDAFSAAGLSAKVTFNDGSERILTDGLDILPPQMVCGEQIVTVRYGDCSFTYTVCILPRGEAAMRLLKGDDALEIYVTSLEFEGQMAGMGYPSSAEGWCFVSNPAPRLAAFTVTCDGEVVTFSPSELMHISEGDALTVNLGGEYVAESDTWRAVLLGWDDTVRAISVEVAPAESEYTVGDEFRIPSVRATMRNGKTRTLAEDEFTLTSAKTDSVGAFTAQVALRADGRITDTFAYCVLPTADLLPLAGEGEAALVFAQSAGMRYDDKDGSADGYFRLRETENGRATYTLLPVGYTFRAEDGSHTFLAEGIAWQVNSSEMLTATYKNTQYRVDKTAWQAYVCGWEPIAEVTVDDAAATKVFERGDTFSSEGLALNVRYENGETERLTLHFSVRPADMDTLGTVKVRVRFMGRDLFYSVSVREFLRLQMEGAPVEFMVGDQFSSEGLRVTALFDLGDSTEEIPVQSPTIDAPKELTQGIHTVTVRASAGGRMREGSYTISCYEVVSFTAPSARIFREGEAFRPLSATVTLTDGTHTLTRSVTEAEGVGFSLEEFSSLSYGEYTVRLLYHGRSETFTVYLLPGTYETERSFSRGDATLFVYRVRSQGTLEAKTCDCVLFFERGSEFALEKIVCSASASPTEWEMPDGSAFTLTETEHGLQIACLGEEFLLSPMDWKGSLLGMNVARLRVEGRREYGVGDLLEKPIVYAVFTEGEDAVEERLTEDAYTMSAHDGTEIVGVFRCTVCYNVEDSALSAEFEYYVIPKDCVGEAHRLPMSSDSAASVNLLLAAPANIPYGDVNGQASGYILWDRATESDRFTLIPFTYRYTVEDAQHALEANCFTFRFDGDLTATCEGESFTAEQAAWQKFLCGWREISSLTVDASQATTVYTAGTSCNVDGLAVDVEYADGTKEHLDEHFTVFLPSEEEMLVAGKHQVRVELRGVAAYYEITVKAPQEQVEKLEATIKNGAEIFDYGVEFSLDLVTVRAKKNNDDNWKTIDASEYEYTAPDMTKFGAQEVVFTYGGQEARLTIFIRPGENGGEGSCLVKMFNTVWHDREVIKNESYSDDSATLELYVMERHENYEGCAIYATAWAVMYGKEKGYSMSFIELRLENSEYSFTATDGFGVWLDGEIPAESYLDISHGSLHFVIDNGYWLYYFAGAGEEEDYISLPFEFALPAERKFSI